MQALHGSRQMLLLQDDGDVAARRRLRNHPQRHLFQQGDDTSPRFGFLAQTIADRAEQRVELDLDGAGGVKNRASGGRASPAPRAAM